MEKFVAAVLLLSAVAFARPFTPEDLVAIPRVQAPAVRPGNATSFAVGVQTWERSVNKKTTNLWLCDVAGACTRLAAQDYVTDFSPSWSPDGKTLFFLSTRGSSGLVQLWAMEPPTGKPYQVTSFPVSVDTFKISPKGNALAFTVMVYPNMTMDETAAEDAKRAANPVSAQKWTRLFVRRWDQWWDDKRSHVLIVKLGVDAASGRWSAGAASTAVDSMFGLIGDCPSRPFGDESEYAWSPDETALAFTTQIGLDIAWSTDLNVYEYVRATKIATCLTCSNPATDTTPVYSPDGRYIAYLFMTTPQYESDTQHIRAWDRSTKTTRDVAPAWDRSPSGLQWAADGSKLYATAEDTARQKFFTVEFKTGAVAHFAGDNSSSGLNVIPCADDATKSCAIFSAMHFQHPSEIYMSLSTGSNIQLTTFSEAKIAGIEFTRSTEFYFDGANGDKVQAYFHFPYGFTESKKWPLILYIHGGPESPWLNDFHYRWNPQVVAARGYAVLEVNFHGSASFGHNFTASILRNWGSLPYEDNMKGIDAAASRYSWIDTKNMAAMGASFGGYMINWINSQNTRFRCLVCHDGVFSTTSNWYETDELYFPEHEFGGLPTDPNTVYAKWSPSTYAANMKTPELVIHGGQDMRISDMSGLSMFNNLQRRGIDSIFIRFPDEDHWVMQPENSIYWHNEIFAWFEKYLNA